MDLFDLLQSQFSMVLSNTPAVIVSIIIFLFILFKRPKVFMYLVLFAVTSEGVVFIFTRLMSLGLEHKSLPFN